MSRALFTLTHIGVGVSAESCWVLMVACMAYRA